jgi:hypothetical protein
VRDNFCEVYLLAVDRKVLAEQQIKLESGTRNRAVGDGHFRAPVETRNFFAALKRVRIIPVIAVYGLNGLRPRFGVVESDA